MMNEAIDEGDDAGSVGEHLVPFDERTVGGDERARLFVAAGDELEEEVGVAVGVGKVADLIDDEEAQTYVTAQAPAQCGIALESGEIAEHVTGGETRSVSHTKDLVLRPRALRDHWPQYWTPGNRPFSTT